MCGSCLSRRTLLAGLSAGALLQAAGARAQTAAARPHRIDVHYHHVAPAWIADADVSASLPPLVIRQAREWTPERAVEEMDRNAIATAVCSVSNPGIWFGKVEQGRRLARECNEFAAGMGRDHRDRFGLFASLPLPDIEGSLKEIAYAFDVLHADGIGLFTSYGDKWLADPAFAPVFEELNRRKATVYVHPIGPACCRNLIPGMPAAVIEYPIDTTRAILDWVMMQSSSRHPDIRIIFSHAGGLITAGVGRLTILISTQEALRKPFPGDLKAEIGKLYYEISSSSDPVTMGALRALVPTTHILLGTDSPFGPMSPTITQLLALDLPPAELRAIERENAVTLMPGLA